MLLCYSPALFVSLIAFFLIAPRRFLLSRISLINAFFLIHYFKRIFEVLFIHKYGNKMAVKGVILTMISYVMFTISTIYAQMVSEDLAEPLINLKWPGLLFFCIGISGNFYHHFFYSLNSEKREVQITRFQGEASLNWLCAHTTSSRSSSFSGSLSFPKHCLRLSSSLARPSS